MKISRLKCKSKTEKPEIKEGLPQEDKNNPVKKKKKI